MNPRNFSSELKRRNVYKVAVAYAVVGWLVIQVCATIVPALHLSDGITTAVVVMVLLGFPIALLLAWAFEMTPEGMKRTENVSPGEAIPQWSRRKFAALIVTVALIAASLLVFQFVRGKRAETASFPAEKSPATSSIPGKSIAVLPFVDMSQAKDQEYFCDGISEEILDELAKVNGLRVVARTSSFSFKGKTADVSEVAAKLNVEHVLEGSLRRAGNRVRITAQLVARDGFHLWSETYDRELSDMFAMQDEITRAVVEALKVKLAVAPPTRPRPPTEAYDLYLKGRFHSNKRTADGLTRSIEYFNQAIAKDPTFALPYTGLADSYSLLLGGSFHLGPLLPRQNRIKAKEAALKALELDDTLSEAHNSLAWIKFNNDWEWANAEKEFRRALQLNPSNANARHWYSHLLMALGRVEESLVESKRALELDKLSVIMNIHLGWHYLYSRQYDSAIEQYKTTLELNPDYKMAHWFLGQAYEQKTMHAEAAAELKKVDDVSNENDGVESDLGYVYAMSGQREAAGNILERLKEQSKIRYVPPYRIAFIYVGLGDTDRAFEWLEKAFAERSDLLVYLNVDPALDSLRSDPRFADLVRRIGLDSAKRVRAD